MNYISKAGHAMSEDRKKHIADILGVEATLAFDLARCIDILIQDIRNRVGVFDKDFFKEQKRKYGEFTQLVERISSAYDRAFSAEDWEFANHDGKQLDERRAQQNEYLRFLLLYIDRTANNERNYAELMEFMCNMKGLGFLRPDDLQRFIMAKHKRENGNENE